MEPHGVISDLVMVGKLRLDSILLSINWRVTSGRYKNKKNIYEIIFILFYTLFSLPLIGWCGSQVQRNSLELSYKWFVWHLNPYLGFKILTLLNQKYFRILGKLSQRISNEESSSMYHPFQQKQEKWNFCVCHFKWWWNSTIFWICSVQLQQVFSFKSNR